MAADGIVVNTFEELELLAAATGKKVLAVGPVSMIRSSPSGLGTQAMSDDARRCMAWLDGKEFRSAVNVSFGSARRLPPAQFMKLGKALVSCPLAWPVLWIVKGADSLPQDISNWIRNNTDESDGGKCLVVVWVCTPGGHSIQR